MIFAVIAVASVLGQAPTPDVLLDGVHIDAAKATLSKAVAAHQTERLFVAMHNKSSDVPMFCLDQLGPLTKREQEQLVARVLLDDSILIYRRGELSTSSTEIQIIQSDLQEKLQQVAYKLLGTNQQPRADFLTRKESTDLAERLNKVSN